jgi:hypothetical protein
MAVRPRLKAQFRPLRRGDGRVQLGLDPAVGVVLEGLSEDEIRLLEHLDGSLDVPTATAWAAERGVPAERVAALLATLREHTLLVETPAHRLDLAALTSGRHDALRADAEALSCAYQSTDDGYAVLSRRTRRRAVVSGSGMLPALIAQALRQAGVGDVLTGRYAADAADAADGATPPDLVVLVGVGAVSAEAGARWMRERVPHLPVVLHGTCAEVGPLVVPGRGPCLMCLHLTRADHDPGWPAVLSQLAPDVVGGPAEVCGETSLAYATAGVAAMTALAAIDGVLDGVLEGALDGHGQPTGTSFRIGLPSPRLEEQVWAAHPDCRCGAAGSADGLAEPERSSQAASATMAG